MLRSYVLSNLCQHQGILSMRRAELPSWNWGQSKDSEKKKINKKPAQITRRQIIYGEGWLDKIKKIKVNSFNVLWLWKWRIIIAINFPCDLREIPVRALHRYFAEGVAPTMPILSESSFSILANQYAWGEVGGGVASWLVHWSPARDAPILSPGRGHSVFFLGKALFTVPLSTHDAGV